MKEFRVHGILEEGENLPRDIEAPRRPDSGDPRKPPFVSFYRGSRVSELALG